MKRANCQPLGTKAHLCQNIQYILQNVIMANRYHTFNNKNNYRH